MADEAAPWRVRAHYYQQFDADPELEVPAEAYGGWQQAEIELAPRHTALVLMHAWDTGGPGQFPGWERAVEYIPRARRIAQEVFPPLLAAVRRAGLTVFHVVGGPDAYYRDLSGYRRAVALAPPAPAAAQITADPLLDRLRAFRRRHVFVGAHNEADVAAGQRRLDFMPEARPLDGEGVAADGRQLFALCRDAGVNHLVYAGFAINWCLLASPGGMVEMSRHGLLCSALRQAVTAVENRETARRQLGKELGLWRVALAYGFVFDVDAFLEGLGR